MIETPSEGRFVTQMVVDHSSKLLAIIVEKECTYFYSSGYL